jgi:Concanavalin A-like lectin/glucanases superfamily
VRLDQYLQGRHPGEVVTVILKSPYPDTPAAPTIITTGLIFALAFAEGTGQTLGAAHGTSYSAVLGSTSSVEANDPNWVTEGLAFTSANADLVTATSVPDTGWLGALTAMVVASISGGSAYRDFLSKSTASNLNMPIEFLTNNAATQLLMLNRGNPSGFKTALGPAVTLGAYRCYSVVCGADITVVPTFYVATSATTGTFSAGSATSGSPLGHNANVRIGRRHDGASQMNGTISYVLVYSRALSAGEIATNYTALQAIMAGRGVTLP